MADHPTITATTIPDPSLGHWDGDFWVEANGYRVSREWCDLLPGYYGPLRKDPDNGLGDIEFTNRMSDILAKVTGVTGLLDCSSEIHGLQFGIYVGYLYLTTRKDIPPVPIFWCGEGKKDNDSHYVLTGFIAGRAGRKIDDSMPDLKTIAGIFAAGGISVGAVLKYILPLIGVSI